MEDQRQAIYRESSLEKISSPDQLDQYLKVTTPAVWILLAAVLLLLGAVFWWSAHTSITSKVTGIGQVKDGVMTVTLEDDRARSVIKEGMTVTVESGEIQAEINSMQNDAEGHVQAVAFVKLPDGTYDVQIGYRQTQLLSLLFN